MEEDFETKFKAMIPMLLKRVRNNEHSKYEELNTYNEYAAAKIISKVNKSLIRSFDKTSKRVFKDYLKSMVNGIDNIKLLFDYNLLRKSVEFFKEEDNILIKAIKNCRQFMWDTSPANLKKFVFQNYDRRVLESN